MLKFKFAEKRLYQAWSLSSEYAVKKSFLKEVENISKTEEKFWDEDSLDLMRRIDGARRDGDYTVVTDGGRGCIHSLSVECQLALLLMESQRRGALLPRTARLSMLGMQSLACLNALSCDIEITLPAEIDGQWVLPEQFAALKQLAETETFIVEDEMAGPEYKNWRTSVSAVMKEIEAAYKGMEPEEEARAFNWHAKRTWNRTVFSDMEQHFTMQEFLDLFGLEAGEYDDFHVTNTCRTFRSDEHAEPGMLFLIDERGICQYPIIQRSFGRTLVNEILSRYRDYKGKAVALVVDAGRDVFRTSDYPRHTEVGAMVDFSEKMIRVYNKELAIRAFHDAYVDKFGEWVDQDA